jgi:hypothetical protein
LSLVLHAPLVVRQVADKLDNRAAPAYLASLGLAYATAPTYLGSAKCALSAGTTPSIAFASAHQEDKGLRTCGAEPRAERYSRACLLADRTEQNTVCASTVESWLN